MKDIILPKVVGRRAKRVGRGYGSGKGGHTTGRGQKGQKARGKVGVIFEGIKVKKSLIKKLPLARGKGKFGPSKKPIIVKLEILNLVPVGKNVNFDNLIDSGIVKKDDAKEFGIKILGDGDLKNKFTVEVSKKENKVLLISKSAAKQVEKKGGKIISEK